MKRNESFRQRLNRIINGAARITIYCEVMRASMELERIRAKAIAYAANNPMPRAVFN